MGRELICQANTLRLAGVWVYKLRGIALSLVKQIHRRNIVPVNTVQASDIESAASVLRGISRLTPVEEADRLSQLAGVPVFLKREDKQICRSFKVRGAFNTIFSLDEQARRRGVVCASAGNHAQGVAYACAALEIMGTIYLPQNTPRQKRQRIQAIGGRWVTQVIVEGNFDAANRIAQAEATMSGRAYVHPFDDARTIAGQGTIAPEIARECPLPFGTVLVPVGGGGLVTGIAVWFKEYFPQVRIVGVEASGSACMRAALDSGGPINLDKVNNFVDGTAVGRAGDLTYSLAKDLLDDVLVLDEGAVCAEMLDLYHSEGVIAEPAGALASAAIRCGALDPQGQAVVCIISGGNNDLSRYAEVLERAARYEGLRHYFLVSFPQEPGALRRFLDEVLVAGEDIVLFEYTKKNNRELGPALVGIELANSSDIANLRQRMADTSLRVQEISADSDVFSLLI